ncbi:MAG: ABC transporter substrate-binding protein [Mycoplasmatales bacterium]
MKKILGLVLISLIILTGCGNKTVDTTALKFNKQGDNYSLNVTEEMTTYSKLIEDLDALDIEFDKNTPVAVLQTSTANILDSLGMNIVAVTKSKDLSDNLKSGIKDGSITNLGSAPHPNFESLYSSKAEVVFTGSNFPFMDRYPAIDNLVVLPQNTYAEIFYTTYGLIDTFSLGEDAHKVFNELVSTDQEAKALIKDIELGNVAILKYAYENVTIAPDNTYAGSLLTELGVKNMYGQLSDIDIPINKEKLLTDNPDIIIIYGKGDDAKQQIENMIQTADLSNLDAYKNKKIFILESQSLNVDIDSPTTLLELSKDLYGE